MDQQPMTPDSPRPGDISQSGMDRKIEKKKWPPKKIGLFAAGGLFIVFILYSFIFGDTSSRLNVDREKITVSDVTKGAFQEFIPENGTVLPIETFFLDAVEGGRVEKIFATAGTFVKKGDPILRLANTNLQLDVMYREALTYDQINNAQNRRLAIEQNSIAVRATLADAEHQLRLARIAYRRDSTLAEKGLIPGDQFKQSRDDYDYAIKREHLAIENFVQDSLLRVNQISQLESSVKRLDENLQMVRQSVDNLVVRAPIAGQLTSLNAEIGQSKNPGQRLGQIDVLDNFKVRVAIDEYYITRINTGQTGEFDLAGSTYRLVIDKVYPEVNNGRFEVDMLFVDKAPPDIRRGQTLQIRLELGDLEQAVMIPRGGFYQKTGGQWIYVLDPSGAFATKRSIKLGRQNPQVFEVLDGLKVGEKVITSSYDTFGDIDKLVF